MGAGTNVQKRLKPLHDLDVPWRPRDLEQRAGRIERRGNDYPEVDIYRYVTEGTFDAYSYQLIEHKQKFIGQLKRGLYSVRAAAERWKTFAREVSGAAADLVHPAFVDGAEAPEAVPVPEGQPVVTIVESGDETLKKRSRLTLSDANKWVERLDSAYWKDGREACPVRLKIDYTLDGITDRYWVDLNLGDGYGDLMSHIRANVDRHREHSGAVAQLAEELAPGRSGQLERVFPIKSDLDAVTDRILGHFKQHCNIAEMELTYQEGAKTLPEAARREYSQAARECVIRLRREANTKTAPVVVHVEVKTTAAKEKTAPTKTEQPPKASVRGNLRRLSAGQRPSRSARPAPNEER